VIAAMDIEAGKHGDVGWGVHFQQGRHRCVLPGLVLGSSEEDTKEDSRWTACAAWANFEPVLRHCAITSDSPPRDIRRSLWNPPGPSRVNAYLFIFGCCGDREGKRRITDGRSVFGSSRAEVAS
jgi:hypothetical protein